MPADCPRPPQAVPEGMSAIVLVDARGSMDLALELSLVLATKTLLSVDYSKVLLPLRVDCVFEQYMRLAGLLLGEPELSFQTSSRSMRQFAKAMEKKGFLVLNTGDERELCGQAAGLVITDVCHSNIDEIFPDSSVFGALSCDTTGHVSSKSDAARAKDGLMQDMLSLQNLYRSTEARLQQLQQKMDKAALKTVEKEFRKLNIRCNAEGVRGQHRKGASRKDKYQSIMHADTDAREFYGRHSSKGGGAKLMLEIQRKTKHLADQIQQKTASLEDKARMPQGIAAIAAGFEQPPDPMEGVPGSGSPRVQREEAPSVGPVGRSSGKDVGAAGQDFERPDTAFKQSADLRGESRKDTKRPATSAASGGSGSTAAGACLKLPQKYRGLLRMLHFEGCSDLLSLPPFADLRRGYKKALLELHPDKKSGAAAPTARDEGSSSSNCRTMPFQDFQDKYREFLATFYDEDRQDFNAGVKMHLPKVKKKPAHPGRST